MKKTKSKATKHTGIDDGKQPSSFKAEMHKGAKPGEWQGAYVEIRPTNVAKLVREMRG